MSDDLYGQQAALFAAAAIRFVGDTAAWRESRDEPDDRNVLQDVAAAHREDAGEGAMMAAQSLLIAGQFLNRLAVEIARQEDGRAT